MKFDEYHQIVQSLKRRKIPGSVKKVVSIMIDRKAEKTVVLKLKGLNDITDFMVICSGNSSRQNQAISDEIQRGLGKEYKLKTFGSEGESEGGWILLDYVDFIIHIFSPESREKYSLEKLWMDAKRYDFYID